MLNNLLAIVWSWPVYQTVSIICAVVAALSAVGLIVCVMCQSSNSSGIGALNGQSETFYSKNKKKSIQSKLKTWTLICLSVMCVFMIIFCFVQFNIDVM